MSFVISEVEQGICTQQYLCQTSNDVVVAFMKYANVVAKDFARVAKALYEYLDPGYDEPVNLAFRMVQDCELELRDDYDFTVSKVEAVYNRFQAWHDWIREEITRAMLGDQKGDIVQQLTENALLSGAKDKDCGADGKIGCARIGAELLYKIFKGPSSENDPTSYPELEG